MLPIPNTLLDKLKQKIQALDTNADMKMEVLAQKAAKYLNQGSFLNARTVRTGNSLSALDVCVRREDYTKEPTEIVMVYIEGGVAKVATLPYVYRPDQNFEYKYSLGPATDVACDFDGRWNYITDRTGLYYDTETVWALQTFGEPYFTLVNGGILSVWNRSNLIQTLADNGVVKCSLLRGHKSVNHVLTDQGVICAYIKNDGKAYYRAYCEQEDGSFIWETEHEIVEFVGTINNLGLFRTADYRTGFLAEINGNIQLLLSTRSWSGMASPREFINIGLLEVSLDVIEISFLYCTEPDEYILINSEIGQILSFGEVLPELRDAWNQNDGSGDWGKQIILRWNDSIVNIQNNLSSFVLRDEYNTAYYPTSILSTDYPNRILLIFEDFNNASGVCTITYTPGTLLWKDDVAVDGDSVSFTPLNLEPTFIPAPVVTSVTNINNQTILIEFDRPIISIDPSIGLTVSGQEPFASPAGQLVPTTYQYTDIQMADAPISASIIDLSSGIMTEMEMI